MRLRLKGLSVVSGGSVGNVDYFNGTPEAGSSLFQSRTIGTDNTTVDRTIPADGVLFKSGMSVKYTVGTIDKVTVFFT
jgi:hypothetical protein